TDAESVPGDARVAVAAQCLDVGDEVVEVRAGELIARHGLAERPAAGIETEGDRAPERLLVVGRPSPAVARRHRVRPGQRLPVDVRGLDPTLGPAEAVLAVAIRTD